MARNTGSDYIPTALDRALEADENERRRQEALAKGFRLGTFKISYTVYGKQYVQTATATSSKDAVDALKQQCGMIGWIPMDISVETLVEPNIYV